MTDNYIQNLKELGGTHYGETLRVFLKEEYDKIRDVRNCKSFEETIGRQLALKTLDELFRFLNDEKVEKASKNQYT